MRGDKVYLGDGVYAEHDGFDVVLTTENGTGSVTNRIVLEWDIYLRLVGFVEKLKREQQTIGGE